LYDVYKALLSIGAMKVTLNGSSNMMAEAGTWHWACLRKTGGMMSS